jgi:helicase
MTDVTIELLDLPRLRNELAQIGARAALKELKSESIIRWRYRSERVVRNLTAVGQVVFEDAKTDQGAFRDQRSALTLAQAWEHLATLEERVDSAAALLNSALFYELAGYQANSACLARGAVDRARWTSEPALDGLISAFLQRMFLRVTTLRAPLTEVPSAALLATDDEIERRASHAVTAIALSEASAFFLTGDDSHADAALEHLALARRGLAQVGDAVAYNAVVGIEHVFPLMVDRSTWNHLGAVSDSPRWRRYLKVLARGLGTDVLEARSVSELWPSQQAAVDGGLLTDARSLAVRMPTSAGKTRVAELAIVHTLVSQLGSKCVYIAPYRALANEIEESFANLFHDLGYAASTVPGGYDQDEMGEELAATDDVLVLTPEKLDLLFRLRADLLDQVALIVIDEGHIVSDRQRGPKFELLISRLRRRIPEARFLMMSAVVPDVTLRDFAHWLGGDEGRSVSSDWRPSLLKYGCLDWDGTRGTLRFVGDDIIDGGLEFIPNLVAQKEFPHVAAETGRMRRPKFPRSESKGDVAAEVTYRYAPLGPVLIFAMQTNWAESIASALLRRIDLAELVGESIPQVFGLRREGRALAVATEWLGEDHLVTDLLRRGIAFHHGRLPDAVRDAIEQDFRARRLGVLVATSTLAQGVNLPVRTVVVHSCRSKSEDGSTRILSARDYWNIGGRAGRAGAETEGMVIHIASSPYDVEDFNRYAVRRKDVERVESALHRMLRDLVAERISSDVAAEQLDSDLLALLVEEDAVALDDESLADTLSSSLFRIQAIETDTPIDPLISVMTATARRISADVPELATRQLFAETGLSSKSCLSIVGHTSANRELIAALLVEGDLGDREVLIDLILAGLAEVREMEPRAALPVDTRDLLSSWLDGDGVKDISDRLGVEDPQELTEFIEDAFAYRLPWGASGYIRIAAEIASVSVTSTLASNIAGMIKYGLPLPEGVWAMSAGVASRRAAVAVADEFLRTNPERSVGEFRRWLGRFDPESIADRLGLVGAELESTAKAILRSQPNKYLVNLDGDGVLLPLRAACRPGRSAIETGFFYELAIGDKLNVYRDRDSRLNRNAVVLAAKNQRLGYLQVDAARALGIELDAGLSVVAEIVEISSESGEPHEVTVEVRET